MLGSTARWGFHTHCPTQCKRRLFQAPDDGCKHVTPFGLNGQSIRFRIVALTSSSLWRAHAICILHMHIFLAHREVTECMHNVFLGCSVVLSQGRLFNFHNSGPGRCSAPLPYPGSCPWALRGCGSKTNMHHSCAPLGRLAMLSILGRGNSGAYILSNDLAAIVSCVTLTAEILGPIFIVCASALCATTRNFVPVWVLYQILNSEVTIFSLIIWFVL